MGTQIPGVGGVPDRIADAGTELAKAANATETTGAGYRSGCSSAAQAAGPGPLAAAVDRFGAALTHYARDVSAHLGALSQLAKNGARDLTAAGGSGATGKRSSHLGPVGVRPRNPWTPPPDGTYQVTVPHTGPSGSPADGSTS